MCCDIFGQEMECSNENQMSLIGGAVLALELTGVIDDITTNDEELNSNVELTQSATENIKI